MYCLKRSYENILGKNYEMLRDYKINYRFVDFSLQSMEGISIGNEKMSAFPCRC